MIEVLGVSIAWETLAWVVAFAASEIIGSSDLKENSVAAMAKGLIDKMKPTRREDEKVSDIKKAALLLAESVKRLDD